MLYLITYKNIPFLLPYFENFLSCYFVKCIPHDSDQFSMVTWKRPGEVRTRLHKLSGQRLCQNSICQIIHSIPIRVYKVIPGLLFSSCFLPFPSEDHVRTAMKNTAKRPVRHANPLPVMPASQMDTISCFSLSMSGPAPS